MKPNILLVPLDWGLGHATRCIPLIRALIRQEAQVFLGGEGKIKSLLQQEFPGLPFVDVKGYDIQYSTNKWSLPLVLSAQIPKFLSGIKYENELLQELVKQQSIDAVISDNRYGLYHPDIPSVFITHQLRIRTGMGEMADDVLQDIHYSYINHFSECWVPDEEDEPNLSGALAHPQKKPGIPLSYIGPLSRFSFKEQVEERHLLFILSGPEPQRTIFENKVLEQLDKFSGPAVLIRGLPAESSELQTPDHLTVYNHLPVEALREKISQSSFVIARCGYSTVMDLACLKKKSILIPTPGQTEQEYLAKHLMEKNFALCIAQDRFRLKPVLELAENFPYQFYEWKNEDKMQQTVMKLLERIASRTANGT